jgi:hypothetical protein
MPRLVLSIASIVIVLMLSNSLKAHTNPIELSLEMLDIESSHQILAADSLPKWKKKWTIGLNGSQASHKNWSQGNTNSVAATGINALNLNYKQSSYVYDLVLNLRYGQTKINGNEVRKTDDLIHIKNRVDHLLHTKELSAYFEVEFRSQFDKGYDKNRVYISDFLAPGYLIETAGLGYRPVDFVQMQMGFSMKQTIMADTSLSKRYGLNPGSSFRSEGGFSMGVGLKKNVAKNLTLVSSVQSFTNFLQPANYTDVMFTNELTGKVNSFMNTNIQFMMVYDKDFNSQFQIKQVLAIGLSFNVFKG